MKTIRQIVSEVAEPKAGDEKAFKAKHIVTKVDYPVDVEDQFTGGKTVKKTLKRKADLEVGEDEKVYEAMDPVNKKAAMGKFKHRSDKDIDNDGDVDSSDKYLHARRKAITKAVHKEEAELDLSDFSVEELEEFMESAEYNQLDEISKKTLSSYVKKASSDMADNAYTLGARDPLKKPGSWNKAFKRRAGIAKAADKLAKEEVEQIDEISKKTLGNYIRKASDDRAQNALEIGKTGKINFKGLKRRQGINRATAKLTKEEVEQLDELSPNTLHSYIKKAAGNMAGNAAVAAAQASSSMKKSSPDVKRNIRNRMRGITGASGRLADKANMAENAWEEVPMMQRQLQFIAYAAEEISDYLSMGVDPEEWFQNKLAGLHQTMLSMYAYAQGEMQMSGGMYGEEVELDESQRSLDAHKFKQAAKVKAGIPLRRPGESLAAYVTRKQKAQTKMQKEEAEDLDEVTQSAVKKPVTATGPDGKTRTVYRSIKSVDRDEHGQEKIKESVLDEAFKTGIVKLKDGGSVVLKKEDADLLNKMFKDLSSTNRKKMQEVAMKDKAGFEEILGFAREAL